MAGCFKDHRDPTYTEHSVETLVMQRIAGIARGYEDLNDHDQLRHDPVPAALAGKLSAHRSDCAPLAGKSTLNRLELSRAEPTRYARIAADTDAIEALFVDLFLDAHKKAPAQITLALDATDDPLHGHQEGRFFHGYYDSYCYLPLYIFCGRHLLAAKLRRSNIDAASGTIEELGRIVRRIRARWPMAATEAGDEGLRRVRVSAGPIAVELTVVDQGHVKPGVQIVPGCGFVRHVPGLVLMRDLSHVTASASDRNTGGIVRPPRSRATTTTRRPGA